MIAMLITFAAYVFAFFLADRLLDGMKIHGGVGSTIAVALLVGFLNFTVGFCLRHMISLGSIGLGYLIYPVVSTFVTALMLIAADKLVARLEIKSFGTAFMAGAVIGLVRFGTQFGLDKLGM